MLCSVSTAAMAQRYEIFLAILLAVKWFAVNKLFINGLRKLLSYVSAKSGKSSTDTAKTASRCMDKSWQHTWIFEKFTNQGYYWITVFHCFAMDFNCILLFARSFSLCKSWKSWLKLDGRFYLESNVRVRSQQRLSPYKSML